MKYPKNRQYLKIDKKATLEDFNFSDFPGDFNLFPTTSPDLPNFGTTDSNLDDFGFDFDLGFGTTQDPIGALFTTNSLLPGTYLKSHHLFIITCGY